MRDLSEKKRSEASLLLADRLHALGLMAAATAHEMNTPLAFLTGSLSYLEAELMRESGEPLQSDLLKAVGDAMEGARRVNRIVRGLRSFARSESGETDAVPEGLPLQGVLDTAIRLTGRFIDAGAVLSAAPPPPGPGLWVYADAPRLVQVFVNLLINALLAMPPPAAPREPHRAAPRAAWRARRRPHRGQRRGHLASGQCPERTCTPSSPPSGPSCSRRSI